jgi:hypothetical protein
MAYLGRTIEGDTFPLVATFTNTAGAPADPTEAVLRIRQPDDTVSVYRYPAPGVGEEPITKDSTGVYRVQYAVPAGISYVRWEGTGALVRADEDHIYGEPSHVV